MRNYMYSFPAIVRLCTIDKKTIIGHLATVCGQEPSPSTYPSHRPSTQTAHSRLLASCSNFHYNYSICRHLKIHSVRWKRVDVGSVSRCNGKCCLYALHNYSCVYTAACNLQGQLAEALTRPDAVANDDDELLSADSTQA